MADVLVMRDIACASYVAGCNTRFFATGKTQGGSATTETCKENMMKRLAFADEVGAPYASMLAFPAHSGQFVNGNLDTVCSVTPRLLPWEVTSNQGANTHSSFPGGQSMFTLYNRAIGLSAVHFGEDMRATENMEFISQGARLPVDFARSTHRG